MRMILSALIATVAAIIVPWWMAGQQIGLSGGPLAGRTVDFSVGGVPHTLHWSWVVFGATFVLAWLLLAAAEQRY